MHTNEVLVGVTALLGVFVLYVFASAWTVESPRDADRLIEAMQVNSGDWVADVGSGDGEYTLEMAEAVDSSGRAFAVDVDPKKLAELHDHVDDRCVDNITVVSSLRQNPMLPRRAFDAVLVRNAYPEFEAHQHMLRHIRAALKPGGRLVLVKNIDEAMVDEEREVQVEHHNLAMRYARRDLHEAGLDVVREVDTLHYQESEDRRTWMMVSTRPSGDRR